MKRLSFFLSLLFVAAFLGSCDKNEQDKTGIEAVENGKGGDNNSSQPNETHGEKEEGKGTPSTPSTPSTGGTEAGKDYVDLGLSVMWATCNIGAENPWDYGHYFAWGDTKGYAKDETHEFNWANCFDTTDGQTFTIYNNEVRFNRTHLRARRCNAQLGRQVANAEQR